MRTTTKSIMVVAGVAGLLLTLGAAPASAHEERKVGKYTLAVGFGDEPAYSGEKNSVQMLIHTVTSRWWTLATPSRSTSARAATRPRSCR
jgi:hypothetical protein